MKTSARYRLLVQNWVYTLGAQLLSTFTCKTVFKCVISESKLYRDIWLT